MRRLALVLILCLLPVLAWAQTAPALRWTHDGVNVTTFEMQIDTAGWNPISPTQDGTTYTYTPTWASVGAGARTFQVRACNASAQCSAAVSLTVVVLR